MRNRLKTLLVPICFLSTFPPHSQFLSTVFLRSSLSFCILHHPCASAKPTVHLCFCLVQLFAPFIAVLHYLCTPSISSALLVFLSLTPPAFCFCILFETSIRGGKPENRKSDACRESTKDVFLSGLLLSLSQAICIWVINTSEKCLCYIQIHKCMRCVCL